MAAKKIRYRIGPFTFTYELVGTDARGIPTYQIVGVAIMKRKA